MLDSKTLGIAIGAMVEMKVKAGDTVIRQGEDGDLLYFVESGALECFVRRKDGTDSKVCNYSSGKYFGELALLHNTPRAATIVAKRDCVLWGMERMAFRMIVMHRMLEKRVKFEAVLQQSWLFKQLEPAVQATISDELEYIQFVAEEDIITQGEVGDCLYLLTDGSAAAIVNEGGVEREVMRYSVGDYFGEIALIYETTRTATVQAVTDCECVFLQRSTFKSIFPVLTEALKEQVQNYGSTTLIDAIRSRN